MITYTLLGGLRTRTFRGAAVKNLYNRDQGIHIQQVTVSTWVAHGALQVLTQKRERGEGGAGEREKKKLLSK